MGCVEIARVAHSVIGNPQAVNEPFEGRQTLDAVGCLLLNDGIAGLDDPSFVVGGHAHTQLTLQLTDPAPTAFEIEEGRHRRVRVELIVRRPFCVTQREPPLRRDACRR